jgi:16S rRNA (guanine(1405)-N(7))-methyltransferase
VKKGKTQTDNQVIEVADQILRSRKYRDLQLENSTVLDLLERELAAGIPMKRAVKETRRKLHNIIAPYLGDTNYDDAAVKFEQAFEAQTENAVRAVCSALLTSHASTRERLPSLEDFFHQIFAIIGCPNRVIDLACGLNPFAFPWMNLPVTTEYHAYDIHTPRVSLINHYFKLQGLQPLGEVRDILLDPPQVEAHTAFFFKEAHRFEQRRRGSNLSFWQALRVRYLLVSLPMQSLSGKHDLLGKQRKLVYGTLESLDWKVDELQINGEIIFIIDKQGNNF